MTVDRAYAALARLAPMALRFDSSTAKELVAHCVRSPTMVAPQGLSFLTC